jgi:hypothetical protein
MTLARQGNPLRLAVLNLVATSAEPELRNALESPLAAGELIINLRAESDPPKTAQRS